MPGGGDLEIRHDGRLVAWLEQQQRINELERAMAALSDRIEKGPDR